MTMVLTRLKGSGVSGVSHMFTKFSGCHSFGRYVGGIPRISERDLKAPISITR